VESLRQIGTSMALLAAGGGNAVAYLPRSWAIRLDDDNT